MAEHPQSFLRAIAAELSCSIEGVRKALKRLNYTKKVMTFYKEQVEIARQNWLLELLSLPKDTCVFVRCVRF